MKGNFERYQQTLTDRSRLAASARRSTIGSRTGSREQDVGDVTPHWSQAVFGLLGVYVCPHTSTMDALRVQRAQRQPLQQRHKYAKILTYAVYICNARNDRNA